jgi:hypothetical protein
MFAPYCELTLLVNDMLKSKKVGFLHIYTTYRKTGNKFPLFVVSEEFELFQHVVDHYNNGPEWFESSGKIKFL